MKHNIIIKKKNLEQQKRKNSLCQVLGNIIIINYYYDYHYYDYEYYYNNYYY